MKNNFLFWDGLFRLPRPNDGRQTGLARCRKMGYAAGLSEACQRFEPPRRK